MDGSAWFGCKLVRSQVDNGFRVICRAWPGYARSNNADGVAPPRGRGGGRSRRSGRRPSIGWKKACADRHMLGGYGLGCNPTDRDARLVHFLLCRTRRILCADEKGKKRTIFLSHATRATLSMGRGPTVQKPVLISDRDRFEFRWHGTTCPNCGRCGVAARQI